MVSREREGLPVSPSSVWEIPGHVIRVAEGIQKVSGKQEFVSIAFLRGEMSGVYQKLLKEANERGDFRIGDKDREVIDLYKNYALEVFRRPDGQIFALRLGMAVEGRLGSIYFSVCPGLQKPEHVEVNDQSTGTDENGFTFQSTRKLVMFFKGDDLDHFDLDVHTNRRLTSKPVSVTEG